MFCRLFLVSPHGNPLSQGKRNEEAPKVFIKFEPKIYLSKYIYKTDLQTTRSINSKTPSLYYAQLKKLYVKKEKSGQFLGIIQEGAMQVKNIVHDIGAAGKPEAQLTPQPCGDYYSC